MKEKFSERGQIDISYSGFSQVDFVRLLLDYFKILAPNVSTLSEEDCHQAYHTICMYMKK